MNVILKTWLVLICLGVWTPLSGTAWADGTPGYPASQAAVNAGSDAYGWVTPKTLGGITFNSLALGDGTISNFYQSHVLIPTPVLVALQTYWKNNTNTSYFDPVNGNDTTAAIGYYYTNRMPSLTLTNAMAIALTNGSGIYFVGTNLTGILPGGVGVNLGQNLTWMLNGGSIVSSSGGGINFRGTTTNYFYDGNLTDVPMNGIANIYTHIVEYYCVQSAPTTEIFNTGRIVAECHNCILTSVSDVLHKITLGLLFDTLISCSSTGANSQCTGIFGSAPNFDFYAKNCQFAINGTAKSMAIGVEQNAGNAINGQAVGIIDNCVFSGGVNIGTNNLVEVYGSNSIVMFPRSIGLLPQQVTTGAGGAVTFGSSTYTLINSPFVIGTTWTNNQVTTATISGTVLLTNAAAGDAIVTFTDLSNSTLNQTFQMPSSLTSGSEQLPISVTINQNDIVEFVNNSTGSGAGVGVSAYPILNSP